jgi:tripartite-type tricarboxylate transporter receptor subunit TctC
MTAARILSAALVASAMVASAMGLGPAQAQSQLNVQAYPTRPIRMVVPFPAGGPTDAMARIVADRMSSALGQTVVVDNRGGGGGGSVGAKAVATAEADGYTLLLLLLLTLPGPITIAPAVYKTLDYDPVRNFVPVAMLIATPLILVVHPALPVHSLGDLVTYTKSNPGKISFASQGFGTAPHLLGEMLKLDHGAAIIHVPYRGTAPAIADLLAGQVQMFFDTTTVTVPHIRGGKVRPLAATSTTRNPQLPDVPTTAEAGFPKLVSIFWLGLFAPAGTPDGIVEKLNAVVNQAFQAPDIRARFADLGAELKLGPRQEFAAFIAGEIKRWSAITAAAGITVD